MARLSYKDIPLVIVYSTGEYVNKNNLNNKMLLYFLQGNASDELTTQYKELQSSTKHCR